MLEWRTYDYQYDFTLSHAPLEDTDFEFDKYAERVGAIVGAFDFSSSDIDIRDITDKIITVGGGTYHKYGNSASTVEIGLKNLFTNSEQVKSRPAGKSAQRHLYPRHREPMSFKDNIRGADDLDLSVRWT